MDETLREIDEHGARLAAALDRINAAVTQIPDGSAATEEVTAEREAERQANADLTERLRSQREAATAAEAELNDEIQELREAMARRDGDVQRLSRVNEELRQSNKKLREANAQGLADPDLVNAGLAAELEGLRAARETDRAEMDEILARLGPLVEEAEHG